MQFIHPSSSVSPEISPNSNLAINIFKIYKPFPKLSSTSFLTLNVFHLTCIRNIWEERSEFQSSDHITMFKNLTQARPQHRRAQNYHYRMFTESISKGWKLLFSFFLPKYQNLSVVFSQSGIIYNGKIRASVHKLGL